MKPSLEADVVHFLHVLECLARIDEYVGADEQRLRASRLVQDAVAYNLQALAEASRRVSDAFKRSEPDVPWRRLSHFADTPVRDVLAIDLELIWTNVCDDLPALHDAVARVALRLRIV